MLLPARARRLSEVKQQGGAPLIRGLSRGSVCAFTAMPRVGFTEQKKKKGGVYASQD